MALPNYISNNSNVQIIMGNLDISSYVDYTTVTVDENITRNNSTMSFTMKGINPGVTQMMDATSGNWVTFTRPRCGMEVVWQNPLVTITAPDGSTQPYREFAGVVTNVSETEDYPLLIYQVTVSSYERWFNRHKVTKNYQSDYPQNIIKDIVTNFCPGFTTYSVQNAPSKVDAQYFDAKDPSEACRSIADLLEWIFFIDYYKDVHFAPAEIFQSPLPGNILNCDTDMQNYNELEINENADQQANKIFIKGFKTRNSNAQVSVFTADGNTRQWTLGYRISSTAADTAVQVYSSISQYNTDANNFKNGSPQAGVAMTLAREVVDGTPDATGANNTAYIHYTNGTVRISNYNNGGTIPANYIVAVRYHIMMDQVFLASDPAAQSATAAIENTDGVYEAVYSDKALTNSTFNAVVAKGTLLLTKYRYPQVSGKFRTFFNGTNSTGWKAGQSFQLISSRRFGGVNEMMFVMQLRKSIVLRKTGLYLVEYEIEFADSPYLL
jgi:hypothetical protein